MTATTTELTSGEKALDPMIASVLEKTAPEAPASVAAAKDKIMQERKRNLERMRSESIYMLGLSVRRGTQKKNLDVRQLKLQLHDELVTTVIENDAQIIIGNGQQSIVVPTFPALRAAGIKLEGQRSRLQRQMVYSDPYWFVFAERLESICAGFEAMQVERTQALDELLEPDTYLKYKIEYLQKLQRILIASKSVSKFQLTELLENFSMQFPTPEQVRADFTVRCQGPIRIPSLTEQSTDDADLAQALASQAQALASQAQAQVSLQQSQALQTLQKEYIENIHKAIYDDAPRVATDSAYALIAELMSELEKADPAKASYRLKNKLQKRVEELQVLVDFNTDLSGIAEQMSQLTHVATSSVSSEHLQKRLSQFKADFLTDLKVNPSEGDGHRALADWVMF